MPHQDNTDVRTSPQTLEAIFSLLLPKESVDMKRHGNASIKTRILAVTAIACWGWTDAERALEKRFKIATAAVKRLFPNCKTGTRQGVCKALATCGQQLVAQVRAHLFVQLRDLKGHWTTAGRPTFAVDGSKFSAPRTKANQDAFSASSASRTSKTKKKKGKKKYQKKSDAAKSMTVQVLLTIFWHVGSGLPACWRLSPSFGSERNTAKVMLDELPTNARIVGDAEYVGYPFWSTIMDSNRTFVVRVGSNIRLLKGLGAKRGKRGEVSCWPDAARKAGEPPLTLRLIEVHTGKRSMWLLTNEWDLTDQQIQEIYCSRWGIEVFFRTVKQNCGRAKLQCRTPDNVLTELNWNLLGIWASLFIARQALHEEQLPLKSMSPIQVIERFVEVLKMISLSVVNIPALNLAECVKADESNRISSKESRKYPRKKRYTRCGAPKTIDATEEQRRIAKAFA